MRDIEARGDDSFARRSDSTIPEAQPPEETAPPEVKPISKTAGGIPAVLTAFKHAFGQIGPVRGMRTLLQLNQEAGVDCPGCAWPEPDRDRSRFEFCEEGAKHVADEATTKRITPEFFKKWSVAELSHQPDLWLNQQGRITHPMVLRQGTAHYEAIEWPKAFELIASELNSLASPDEAIFYISCGSLARTICPIVRICAMNRAAPE